MATMSDYDSTSCSANQSYKTKSINCNIIIKFLRDVTILDSLLDRGRYVQLREIQVVTSIHLY